MKKSWKIFFFPERKFCMKFLGIEASLAGTLVPKNFLSCKKSEKILPATSGQRLQLNWSQLKFPACQVPACRALKFYKWRTHMLCSLVKYLTWECKLGALAQ